MGRMMRLPRNLIQGLIVLVVMLSNTAAIAEPLVAVLDPAAGQLQEVYKDEVPVSGRVIAGLSLAGVPLPGKLAIFPQASASGSKVCVQVMSRDGRYWAQNNFLIPAASVDGPVRLQYDSRYSEQLNQAAAFDLAILSYLGPCVTAGTPEYVLSSRAKLSDQANALVIYVNSARADTYASVVNRSKRGKPTKCRRFTEGRRTGYDTICEIALQDGDAALEQLQVKVFRRKYEKSLKPVDLRVRLPR